MVTISFHMTPGTGFVLISNEILHKSEKLGREGPFEEQKGVIRNTDGEVVFKIYCGEESDSLLLRTSIYSPPTAGPSGHIFLH